MIWNKKFEYPTSTSYDYIASDTVGRKETEIRRMEETDG
jgi:hypothetical protein